jgi:sensor c-di-GMP phosphodiesterase-like protein
VESRADFLAARELGFNLVQGALFAKSMTVKKFARVLERDACRSRDYRGGPRMAIVHSVVER